MDCYTIDGIIGNIQKEISREEAITEKWQNVTFPTKKDGKPFAAMGKNISGARYSLESYAMQAGEYELTVTTWANGSGYISDTIKAHSLVKYLQNDAMKAKTGNYMPKQSYLEQVYKYDLDDIKAAVAARIEQGKKRIAALKKSEERAREAHKHFREAYRAALENLAREAGKTEECTLYYNILETVEKHERYL